MKILYLGLLLLVNHLTIAQSTTSPIRRSVRGYIVDEQKLPLPHVAIIISDQLQKPIITITSDEKGNFSMSSLPTHQLNATFSMIGFTSQTITIPAGEENIDLKTVTLVQDVAQLKEVTVNAGSNISYLLDKKVFLAGKDIIAQSGSATDLLASVPSVSVSPTGAISLRGNSSVLILVNGRRSGVTNALDQIPADQIDRFEIITNPSSRYEAAGAGGIVNIILKKNNKGGFNGQLRAVGGIPNETRINPSLNYKSERINLFSNFGLRLSDYVGIYHTNRAVTKNTITNELTQFQDEQRHDDNLSFYVGADINLSEKSSVTTAFLKNIVDDNDQTQLYSAYSTRSLGLDSTLVRNGASTEKRSYNQFEFNYTRNFENQRKKLTVDIQYDFWDSDKKWDLLTAKKFPHPAPLATIRTSAVGASKDLAAQSDFVLPLDSLYLLELGLKVENRTVSSDFLAEQQQNFEWEVIENINNQVAYEEMIAGAYAQLAGKSHKISYQIGLRTEWTRVDINDRTGAYSDHKNYSRLFPSINFSYEISNVATLQTSYSRRVERPSLYMIYPFNELTDLSARFVGNPSLNPSFANLFEIGFLHRYSQLTLNPSVYLLHRYSPIVDFTNKTANDIFVTMPINIDKEWRRGIEISLTYEAAQLIQLSAECNVFQFKQFGSYGNQNFDFKGSTFTGRLGGAVKLPKLAAFQVRYNLTGAKKNAQRAEQAIHNVDFGASRILLSDKASILFDVSNLFNLRAFRQTTTNLGDVFNQENRPNGSRYRLTFVYRLNLKPNQNVRQAKTGNRS